MNRFGSAQPDPAPGGGPDALVTSKATFGFDADGEEVVELIREFDPGGFWTGQGE